MLKTAPPRQPDDLTALRASAVAPAAGDPAALAAVYAASGTAGGTALFRSTKTYGHNEGLSCVFRQWHATDSHCRLLHGYALAFTLVFVASELDARNWCFDFGGLKPVRAWLHHMFDHTFLVAEDDPELEAFQALEVSGILDLRILPASGCEAIARLVFDHVAAFLLRETGTRVLIERVEVSEHSGNSASYSIV